MAHPIEHGFTRRAFLKASVVAAAGASWASERRGPGRGAGHRPLGRGGPQGHPHRGPDGPAGEAPLGQVLHPGGRGPGPACDAPGQPAEPRDRRPLHVGRGRQGDGAGRTDRPARPEGGARVRQPLPDRPGRRLRRLPPRDRADLRPREGQDPSDLLVRSLEAGVPEPGPGAEHEDDREPGVRDRHRPLHGREREAREGRPGGAQEAPRAEAERRRLPHRDQPGAHGHEERRRVAGRRGRRLRVRGQGPRPVRRRRVSEGGRARERSTT